MAHELSDSGKHYLSTLEDGLRFLDEKTSLYAHVKNEKLTGEGVRQVVYSRCVELIRQDRNVPEGIYQLIGLLNKTGERRISPESLPYLKEGVRRYPSSLSVDMMFADLLQYAMDSGERKEDAAEMLESADTVVNLASLLHSSGPEHHQEFARNALFIARQLRCRAMDALWEESIELMGIRGCIDHQPY